MIRAVPEPNGAQGALRAWRTIVLTLLLLSAIWPEIDLHDGTATSPTGPHGDTTHELVDLHGDDGGLHLHVCACAAHCAALPSATDLPQIEVTASPVTETCQSLPPGVAVVPFRPPIA
ncbi:hypothetical protein PC39_14357 [Salinisphaera sp. PC39]|uniref:hypothetical protein n=1 Tax=Salinisphaera sp. PC39 TaxID=1304156 RepID=UPI0033423711